MTIAILISRKWLCAAHPGVSETEWGDDGQDNVTAVLTLLPTLMSAKASYLPTVVLSHFIYCSQDSPLPT